MYFLKFLLHLGMWDLVALGADLLVERYNHLLFYQPENKEKYFFVISSEDFRRSVCFANVIFNLSLNYYFLTLRVLFLSLARNDFSRSRRWSSRRHVGWKQFVIWGWCHAKGFWMLTCFSEVGDHVSESSPGKLE